MKPILDRIRSGEILMSDGALGTMLIARGLQPGQCPEMINLEQPEWLTDIARAYLEAGSEIITTNTFGGSPMKLADYGLEDKTEEINRRGVELVKSVAKGQAYTAASCGSTGKILQPYGEADPEDVHQSFLRQMKALVEAGADIIMIETMIDLDEAIIAVKAAREISPKIPICATMTFNKTKNGYFTVMGSSIKEVASGLEGAGADIIGSNCGNGLDMMIEIAREFKTITSLPIIIQSNAGLPEIRKGELHYTESPSFFKERTPELVEAGVSIIGGCCGTTPEYIREMKTIL
ncbi:MAG: homocysteine S-methyltransferase family protein [Candidatus Hatepunaea meridiana]|nr:homocysteine S-methyltransferase family protein [Candidatus Hatepunaea meridiana]